MLTGNSKKMLIYVVHIFVLACGFLFFAAGASQAVEQKEKNPVKPTPFSMDFYGYIDGVVAGDRLRVFDPDGIMCGEFIIKKDGQYGFLHVYGDDPSTGMDEGAKKGDKLTFELNGEPIMPFSIAEVYWLGDRERQRVDFNR